jgi:hypothetical protein
VLEIIEAAFGSWCVSLATFVVFVLFWAVLEYSRAACLLALIVRR